MSKREQRRKQKADPAIRQARLIGIPESQLASGQWCIRDVANHSEADHRHTIRSKETRTVRRLTHLEKLVSRKVLTPRQAQVCQWYADQHEKGFVATCTTANYSGMGGSRPGTMDLLAKTRDQYLARESYARARSSISPMLVSLFERVVLHRLEIGDGETWRRKTALKRTFLLAVEQLDRECGHLAGGE
jgi:hypothetical protein